MPSNTHNTCATLAALALTLCSSTSAWAQDDAEQQAGENYQIAVDLLNEGRYAESVDAFTRAIELSPDPVFYCNRSAALVRLLEYERAIEDLTHCRDNLADAPEITARADAQLKALSLYTKSVRGRAFGVARDIAAGPIVKKDDPLDPPGQVTPQRESSALAVMGGIGLGLGGASLALAAGLDVLSQDVVADFKASSTGTDSAEYDRLRGEVVWRQQAFYGSVIAGSALLGLGAALLIVDALGAPAEPTTTTTIRVGPGSIFVTF